MIDLEVATLSEPLPRPLSRGYVRRLYERTSVVVSAAVVLTVLAWAAFPSLWTSQDPVNGVPREKFSPPSSEHLLGTDHLGRDVFTRVMYGSESSVTSAVLAVAIGVLVGALLGALAAHFGGVLDAVTMRLVDVLLSVPGLLVAMTIVVGLGFSTTNAAIAVGVTSIAIFARLMRSEVVRTRASVFVEAASISGCTRGQVLVRHILPNSLASLVSLAVLNLGTAILAIASLAFLGYGNPPPEPDWGILVSEGRQYMSGYPWIVFGPGVVIVALVLAINRLRLFVRKDR